MKDYHEKVIYYLESIGYKNPEYLTVHDNYAAFSCNDEVHVEDLDCEEFEKINIEI